MTADLLSAPIPTVEALRTLLDNLLNTSVTTRQIPAHAAGPVPHAVIALYTRRDAGIAAAWTSDLSFGAFAGAALTRFPRSVADQEIARRLLGDGLLENFTELMNVGARLFNDVLVRHVHILATFQPALAPVPTEGAALLAAPAGRLDVAIDIPGYGTGRTCLLTAPA